MAKKTTVDGIIFDSPLEAAHYKYLKKHPKIKIIDRQVEFSLNDKFTWLDIKPTKITKKTARKMVYTPDFLIEVEGLDKLVIIETKGHARKDYMMRKKLFLMKYPEYYFVEIGARKRKKDIEPINLVFDRYK